MATIALVDDHRLLRTGLATLLHELGHEVLFEAGNGIECLEKLKKGADPQVLLLDISMPQMDGYETAAWVRQHRGDIKILALSMYDDEYAIIKMLRNGVRGYVLKDADPGELKRAIHDLLQKGFFYSDRVNGMLLHNIHNEDSKTGTSGAPKLNTRETEFLRNVCTEMTYKEIADKMCVSPRTIDGYRDDLFEKLVVKSRVGLVLFAIKNGIVKI